VQPVYDKAGASGFSVAEENLQSRVRGTLLMALSNKLGRLLLTTGNKSELAVGYCTLYGDMNGGLAVLSDISKQWVYRLARWINAQPTPDLLALAPVESAAQHLPHAAPIPESSITKPPSAELRPNQKDQDSLPPYNLLDRIIECYVERRMDARTIAATLSRESFDGVSPETIPATVARIVRLIDGAVFKRKQAAIGLKVTGVAFGSGRRVPIAQRYRVV
jgi:NAD+ synthetase